MPPRPSGSRIRYGPTRRSGARGPPIETCRSTGLGRLSASRSTEPETGVAAGGQIGSAASVITALERRAIATPDPPANCSDDRWFVESHAVAQAFLPRTLGRSPMARLEDPPPGGLVGRQPPTVRTAVENDA